ncbi:MAG: hypothetical protein RLY93_01090 [Sumerlaeia bacterium]
MQIFQLIQKALDDLYPKIPGSDLVKDVTINNCLKLLQHEYKNLAHVGRVPIDYRRPEMRFAYIYKYTTAHSDYINKIIPRSSLAKLFDRDTLKIACVGGGPGSDLIGILKYMILFGNSAKVTFYLYDKEPLWGESWAEIGTHLDDNFRIYPIFQPIDILNSSDWRDRSFSNIDLYTFSYFISEIYYNRTVAKNFFKHILTQAKVGAQVLYVDNNDKAGSFVSFMKEVLAEVGFEIEIERCEEMVFGSDEQKDDLGIYFQKFGWPKRKGNICYLVARKVK